MAITLDPTMSAMMNTGNVYNNAQLTAANRLSEQIEGASNDEDTLQACKDFEAYMLENIFKKMSESAKLLADDEEEDSSKAYVEAFEDNYYQDIAQRMMASGQGVGIAEQLYQSITNQKLGISNDTTTADQATKQLAEMTGATTEDIRKMTPQEQAEVAAMQAEASFADALNDA
ncbi:MAG: rod-binding protein [Eubacterium sp.]|nr:rod-binding protein [Eubacterium sp.]